MKVPQITPEALSENQNIPSEDFLKEAEEALTEKGLIHLRGAFDPAFLGQLRDDFFATYAGLEPEEFEEVGARVGHERYMVSMPLKGVYFDTRLYAHPLLMPLAERLLTEEFVLNSFTAVCSFTGADSQHVHRDQSLLFMEAEKLSLLLPPYALSLAIPLVDLTERCGGTQVWVGSHLKEPNVLENFVNRQTLYSELGDAFLLDYRVIHGGMPNHGAVPRPILYLVYSRRWFRDLENFKKHPPLRVAQEELEQVPESLRELFWSVPNYMTR